MSDMASYFPDLSLGENQSKRPLSFFYDRILDLLTQNEGHALSRIALHNSNKVPLFTASMKTAFHKDNVPHRIMINAVESMAGHQVQLTLLERCPEQTVEGLYLLGILLQVPHICVCIPLGKDGLMSQLKQTIAAFQNHPSYGKLGLPAGFQIHIYQMISWPKLNQPAESNGPTCVMSVEDAARFGPFLHFASSTSPVHVPATKLVGIFGDVHHPHVMEVPLGQSLKTLINQQAKGIVGGWQYLAAIFVNGPFSRILTQSDANALNLSADEFFKPGLSWESIDFLVVNQSRNIHEVYAAMLGVLVDRAKASCMVCEKGMPWLVSLLRQAMFYEQTEVEAEIKYLHDILAESCTCGLYADVLPFISQMKFIKSNMVQSQNTTIEIEASL